MRILLKYSLLTLVVLCLNIGLAETLSVCQEYSPANQETQFTAHHAQSVRQAINNFYDHCPEMPCDTVHHVLNIPPAKCLFRSNNSAGRSCLTREFLKKKDTISTFSFPFDPNSYYIFGLRKIVI